MALVALAPSPPKAPRPQAQKGGTSPLSNHHHHGALTTLAKGVELDAALVRDLLRREATTRRDVADSERAARDDVVFLIAAARSEYRKLDAARVPAAERKAVKASLDIVLFDDASPRRVPKSVPEFRPQVLKSRPVPPRMTQLCEDESQLRDWLGRLEAKGRETLDLEHAAEVEYLNRFNTCSAREDAARRVISTAESDAAKQLFKFEFVNRPFFRPLPKQRDPTFEESEEIARAALATEETMERKALHDWLCMRYGVRLFSVARTEDIYRVEIMEEFDSSFTVAVSTFFHERYQCPMLAMAAVHAGGTCPGRHATLLGAALRTSWR